MARLDDRNPDKAAGEWFIDRRCIDCGASPHVAPGLIDHRNGRCVFIRQPVTADEIHASWLAVDVCPTNSVGAPRRLARPAHTFPLAIATRVHLLGHNSPDSYGAHSWLVERAGGNLLIDSPRYTRRLHEHVDALGGVAHVLLSHRDDVADARQWAERYGASVVIHRDDQRAAPFADYVIDGREPVAIADDVLAVPVPGHTRGSVVYLCAEQAFTGDSLAWDTETDRLYAFRDACWYSWDEQRESLRRLADHRFGQVFAGHGRWSPRLDPYEMSARLRQLVDRM
jgi:glyoxylase-like metal-dependent hydrolase (beta-lactamase superfamily II)